jgi:DNA replication and repair protein RecF
LFARLAGAGGQVWMTGTDAELFADAPAGTQHLTVAAGAIR